MPTPQDRDELDAQDPFARTELAERGYRVGARLARPRDRRPQAVAFLTGTAVLAALVIAALRIDIPQAAVRTTPRPGASGPIRAIPTRLPALQQFAGADALSPFPVFSGGLRWLDPHAGVISGPPFSGARGWIFAGSDSGAWCVCYDAPWSQTGTVERTTVVRYDATGAELSRTTVGKLASSVATGDAIQRDAVRSPDGRFLYLAAAIRDETGWAIRLDQIGLSGRPSLARTFDVGRIERSPDGTIVFPPVVRVSPDGSLVRVAARFLDRGRIGQSPPTEESVWIVQTVDANGVLPGLVGVVGRRPIENADCETEAWITNSVYGRLCVETVDDRRVPIAHLEALAGGRTDVQVGDPVGTDDIDWLVDGSAGIIYRWSRFSHVLARLDTTTGDVEERVDLGATPASVRPDTDRPLPRAGRADWQPLLSAESVQSARLAGSVDGSLLFAVGTSGGVGTGPSGPLFASTGIWVIDAATLGLVAHWPSAAMDDQIGVSPDGRFVLAVGLEGMTADGEAADWPPSLAIRDATDGHVVEQVSRLTGDEGFFVGLLDPGPVP